jgi:ribonuclease G
MNKEMIISSGAQDTRVAILEDDQVVEVFIERERQRGVVGNIYKGRVSKVLPGMQSSFVDIGLERDAFLYVTEVVPAVEELDRLESGDDEDDAVAQAAPLPAAVEAVAAEGEEPVPVPAGGPADAPDGSGGAAQPAQARAPERRGRDRDRDRDRPEARIEDLLKEGQEVLVQVVKEPLGTKGARLTSHVTMPGRFLVFMPTVDHVGVSRKIDSREERARLRGIVKEFRDAHGFTGGVIIRTAAANRSKEDIVSDLTYFHQVWTEIRQKMEASRRPPVTLFQEQSLVTKLLRDLLTDDYTAIRIDNEQEHRRVVALVERIMPALVPRVKLYTKDYPIFEEYGVQAEIDKALRSKVWLKSGGYLVINQTEALVAIDVNTGRYVGKKSSGRLEDTIVKTNLEAVKEIVRQLRLRDLGGIIVLDLIDMEEKKNRQKVFQEVERELRKDRSPSKALQVSDFGLVIVTRKRVKQSIERQLTDPCPYCSGSGSIKSASTICYEILMEMKKIAPDLEGQGVLLRVNPDIARALKEEESAVLRELQQLLGRQVTIKADSHLHHEQFDVMAV